MWRDALQLTRNCFTATLVAQETFLYENYFFTSLYSIFVPGKNPDFSILMLQWIAKENIKVKIMQRNKSRLTKIPEHTENGFPSYSLESLINYRS